MGLDDIKGDGRGAAWYRGGLDRKAQVVGDDAGLLRWREDKI